MTMPDGACPINNRTISATRMLAEEMLVGISGDQAGKIHGSQRNFYGQCPDHGTVLFSLPIGNHGTILEKNMRQMFPKDLRKVLLDRLSGQERKDFNEAWHGRHSPDEQTIARWRQMIAGALPSSET